MVVWYVKKYLEAVCLVIISVFIGAGALMAVYSLPTGRMFHNAQKSLPLYQAEGNYPSWARGKTSAQLDNFTDSIMVRKAIFPGTGDVVHDAMLNPSYGFQKTGQVESLVRELKRETEGRYTGNYARYWHGYLLFMKPALLLRPVQDIREFNGLVQLVLAVYLIYLLGSDFGKRYGIAYFMAYLSLNPVSLAMSFQFSTMYYIASLGMLFILKRPGWILKNEKSIFLFTFLGILTAFFDFLTYPLVSFGLPITVFLLVMGKEHLLGSKWSGILKVIGHGAAWAIGYGGMYMGKWLLSWMLTGYNTWLEASRQAAYRMSTGTAAVEGGSTIHIGTVIRKNLNVIFHDPVVVVLLLSLCIALYLIYRNRKEVAAICTASCRYALGLVALSPFAWYIVLSNHSFIHYWFTFRELSITVFAIACLLCAKLDEKGK